MLDPTDTIAAVASPPGPSERGVVRLSGPRAVAIAASRFTPDEARSQSMRAEHRAGQLRVTGLHASVPARLVAWPGTSFTGEPAAEIHTIGSLPILEAILADALASGARLAEPGEFSLRAFLHGRIDLTQAEAVLGVIEARDASQLHHALEQLAGGIASPIERLRDRLLDVLAHLEADLDFADEPDVDPIGRGALADELAEASAELRSLADRLDARARPETLPRVVLHGPPNAGKSRLFNALAGGSPALVSSIPGTTRDYLSTTVACAGLDVELIDTSGVEAARDEVEALAHEARDRQVRSADLVLNCAEVGSTFAPVDIASSLPVSTKADLAMEPIGGDVLATSAATGFGPRRAPKRHRVGAASHADRGRLGDLGPVPGQPGSGRRELGVGRRDADAGRRRRIGGDRLAAVARRPGPSRRRDRERRRARPRLPPFLHRQVRGG